MDIKFLIRKYLGRQYGRGMQSCLRFVKEFYASEFNIAVPVDYFDMLQVMKVVKHDPQIGDVVVMKNHPIVTNHLGIYLEKNEFLQAGAGINKDEVVLSRTYERPWNERIQGYLRHQNNDKN